VIGVDSGNWLEAYLDQSYIADLSKPTAPRSASTSIKLTASRLSSRAGIQEKALATSRN
jgi:hypothetical protein